VPSFTFPPEPDRDLLEALGLLLPVTLTVPVPLKRYLENQGFERMRPSLDTHWLIRAPRCLPSLTA